MKFTPTYIALFLTGASLEAFTGFPLTEHLTSFIDWSCELINLCKKGGK